MAIRPSIMPAAAPIAIPFQKLRFILLHPLLQFAVELAVRFAFGSASGLGCPMSTP
jgi:hypothetical protein